MDELLNGLSVILTHLDVEYYRAEKKEDREQIKRITGELFSRFDEITGKVFDRNTGELTTIMEAFNQSEKEIEKFKNRQSRITELTGFLMGLLEQVDALLFGLRRDRLPN